MLCDGACTYLVRPLSQSPEGQENKTKHHAERDNAPLDVSVFKQECHTCRASPLHIDRREGSSVKEDMEPDPSCNPSVEKHEAIHAEASDDGKRGSFACHEDEQRQLGSAKDRRPIGEMPVHLIALACGTGIERVLVSDVEIIECDEWEKVGQG